MQLLESPIISETNITIDHSSRVDKFTEFLAHWNSAVDVVLGFLSQPLIWGKITMTEHPLSFLWERIHSNKEKSLLSWKSIYLVFGCKQFSCRNRQDIHKIIPSIRLHMYIFLRIRHLKSDEDKFADKTAIATQLPVFV